MKRGSCFGTTVQNSNAALEGPKRKDNFYDSERQKAEKSAGKKKPSAVLNRGYNLMCIVYDSYLIQMKFKPGFFRHPYPESHFETQIERATI